MDPACVGSQRGAGGKKRDLATKEGTFPCRRILQEDETCAGDVRPVKIDSCRVINNSSLLLVPF